MITAKVEELEYKNDYNVYLDFYCDNKTLNTLSCWDSLTYLGAEYCAQKKVNEFYQEQKIIINKMVNVVLGAIDEVKSTHKMFYQSENFYELKQQLSKLHKLIALIDKKIVTLNKTNPQTRKQQIHEYLTNNNFILKVCEEYGEDNSTRKFSLYEFQGKKKELIENTKNINSAIIEQHRKLTETKLCEANNYLETIGVNQLIQNYKSAVKEAEEQTENEK